MGAHEGKPTTVHQTPPALRRSRHDAIAARSVQEVCADARSTAELIDGLRAPFNAALGVSGMIVGSTDPATAIMSTATLVENLPASMAEPWMHNEILDEDFNKFSTLHHTGVGAATLGRATQGNPHLSPRYRLHLGLGFGPEMRVTFSTYEACWGVAGFVREMTDPDFDDEAVAWIERLRPHISQGLRRTVAVEVPAATERTPGVVSLDADGPVGGAPARAARTRLRGRSGEWITVRGDCTRTTDGELSGVVLVIEPSRPAEILPLVVASYGLTRREREVLSEMSNGQSTAEIARGLFISEHTVRDHIKSILAKTGTNSRGELMSLLFQHRA